MEVTKEELRPLLKKLYNSENWHKVYYAGEYKLYLYICSISYVRKPEYITKTNEEGIVRGNINYYYRLIKGSDFWEDRGNIDYLASEIPPYKSVNKDKNSKYSNEAKVISDKFKYHI